MAAGISIAGCKFQIGCFQHVHHDIAQINKKLICPLQILQVSDKLQKKLARMQQQEQSWQAEAASASSSLQTEESPPEPKWHSAASPFGAEMAKKLQQRNAVVVGSSQRGVNTPAFCSPSPHRTEQQPVISQDSCVSELQARFQKLRARENAEET
jgi:hypothetical protein